MQASSVRRATHAGSWYTDNKETLDKELNKYLEQAQPSIGNTGQIKAIIGPHAGLIYSGPTAAWVYKLLKPKESLRVFLLGPCHHAYIKGCGITNLKT
jgi:AmmeMemoRadiSam system protein B